MIPHDFETSIDFDRFSQSSSNQEQWEFGAAPLNTPASMFGPFADLIQIWQDRRSADQFLPSRDQFVAEDFAQWLGRVFIAKVERNPFNVRYTLWGTELTEWWGVDYTGKLIGEASSDPGNWEAELAYFEEMDKSPFFGLASGRLTLHERDHIRAVGIDLPLGSAEELTHIVAAHIRIEADMTLKSFLASEILE